MKLFYVTFYLAELFLDRMEVPETVFNKVKDRTFNNAQIDGLSYDIKSVNPIESDKVNVSICVCQVEESKIPVL